MLSSVTMYFVVEGVVDGSFGASLDVLIEVAVVDVEDVTVVVALLFTVVVATVVASSGVVLMQRPLRNSCPFPVQ